MALTTNIVSYWKFDSSNSNDSVSTNNGTDTSITYSSGNGKINIGAGFNGTSSKINLGTSTSLAPSNITIAAWIKLSATGAYQQILTKDYADSGNANTRCYQFRISNTNKIEFVPFNSSTNADLLGNTSLSSGTWYHVAATWDSTTAIVYLNGSSDGSTSFSGPMRTPGTSNTYIGCDQNGGSGANNYFFNGAIDEVGIWSRALSSTEISQLYNSGTGFQYPFTTTNIKTIDTLAKASVKTIQGLAIASVKTWDGLA